MSIWVVFNFLNQFSNAGAMQLFHGRMWWSWNIEVHVFLNSFTNCLMVGVERLDLMIYFRVVLYCDVVFIKFP